MLTKGFAIAVSMCMMVGVVIEADAKSSLGNCARCRLLSGWGMGTVPESAFDPAKIKTVEGQVVSVQDLKAENDVVGGVYVLLKTKDDSNVAVRLAPSSYILSSGLSIEPYDTLTVTGSEVEQGILATQVRKGSDSVQVRSPSGAVAWR